MLGVGKHDHQRHFSCIRDRGRSAQGALSAQWLGETQERARVHLVQAWAWQSRWSTHVCCLYSFNVFNIWPSVSPFSPTFIFFIPTFLHSEPAFFFPSFHLSTPTSPPYSWWLQDTSLIPHRPQSHSFTPRTSNYPVATCWQPTNVTYFLYTFINILHILIPTFLKKYTHTYSVLPYTIFAFVHLTIYLGDCYMSVQHFLILFRDFRAFQCMDGA